MSYWRLNAVFTRTKISRFWLVVTGLFIPVFGVAADKILTIGYLEFEDDPRYREKHMEARYPAQPLGRPYGDAQVAIKESRFSGAAVGIKLNLKRIIGRNVDELE